MPSETSEHNRADNPDRADDPRRETRQLGVEKKRTAWALADRGRSKYGPVGQEESGRGQQKAARAARAARAAGAVGQLAWRSHCARCAGRGSRPDAHPAISPDVLTCTGGL